MSGILAVFHAAATGAWRDAPGRALLAILGIACGVALGAAVHLINAAASAEFDVAARALSGTADLVVRGPRQGFAETLYPRIARAPGIAVASPAVEVEATLADMRGSVKILGIDPFRAALVQPALVHAPGVKVASLLGEDAVWLSETAAHALRLAPGDSLRVRVGTSVVSLRVAALLPHDAYPEALAIADIATAQWRLAQLGRLQRIDIKLKPDADPAAVAAAVAEMLPSGVLVSRPDVEAGRATGMTRAYRLNLDMLALVALFTGAFLVFSTQFLALMRRRTQFALLRVLGVTRRALLGMLLAEGALLGATGSVLGIAAAQALAAYVVHRYGVDLGAGYFSAQSAVLAPQWDAYAAYFALGVAFSVLGAAPPAFEVTRRPPALALRAGDEQDYVRPAHRALTGIALLAAGLGCASLPAVEGLPWAGYAGIALLLVGTVTLMPGVATGLLRSLPAPGNVSLGLAVARVQAAPRQAAVTVAAIVTSLSLMVSMLIMVASFRDSLDAWLHHMLPADAYLRTAPAGDTGFLTSAQQDLIATTPGVQRVTFIRSHLIYLRPEGPPVTVLARTIDPARPGATLALQGAQQVVPPGGPPPAWISEAAHDVYGWNPGAIVRLPLAGAERAFMVAGLWRDYARQTPTVVIERTVYERYTGDRLANDAAIWLAPGMTVREIAAALHERIGAAASIELDATAEVRARSLALFDRTFAVTYGLEAVAVLIGLLGVSASFGAQTLARRRELGVLRHIGMTRAQIAAMLGAEGGLLAALGAATGLALGIVIGLVLIHVVNRQSFHWSMDLHLPVLPLLALAATLIACSALVAAWTARQAMRRESAQAVREDW